MALLDVVLRTVLVTVGLIGVSTLVVVGPRRFVASVPSIGPNLRAVARPLVALLAVLLANSVIRDVGVELSWLIGVNVTGYIHAVEGGLVVAVQSLARPSLTAYFSSVYVYGYVFLLVFPFVAYVLYDDPEPLRASIVAYGINYGIGLLCYVLFVAYGPRNFMPELVEPLLYMSWPQSQLLTSQVNVNTNVFPSLHTSLSATVALLAYRYHAIYPRWTPVAWLLAVSVAVSTMYLGIHWGIDVFAGIVLAAASVSFATNFRALTLDRLREICLRRS